MMMTVYNIFRAVTELHMHTFDSDLGVQRLTAWAPDKPHIGNILFCQCGVHKSFDLLTEDDRAQMS